MKNKKVKFWGLTAAVAGAALLLSDALFFEKYFFEIKAYRLGNKAGRKTIRLVLLTDLHIKKHLWPYYKRLARTVNRLQPDLILIGGDTLDGNSNLMTVDAFLGMLRHSIEKVAILGNHDHFDGIPIQTLAGLYAKHNCKLLVNETATFYPKGERLVVTGLDDFIESTSCVVEALEGVAYEANHIMLLHSPLQQESVLQRLKDMNEARQSHEQLNIGYIFAGHNHGGQVRLLNLVPKLPIMSGTYIEGWYNTQSPYLYVSKGFGTSTVPFRFGARAELDVFEYGV